MTFPRVLRTAQAVAGVLSSALATERPIVEDSLLGTTVGERFGGVVTAGGFAPLAPQDHLLYRVPAFFPRGYLTFEIRGMWPIPGGDPAFLAVYDGRGIEEPARYHEDFRDNFFRFNLHWRGTRGALKCVVNCARPTEERRQATRAVFAPGETRDWVAEPMGEPVAWDPEKWHQVRVDWSETEIAVSVDRRLVWHQNLMHPYRPVQARIWLGCAPGAGTKYTHQVSGLYYRHFRLVRVDGASGRPGGAGVGSAGDGSVNSAAVERDIRVGWAGAATAAFPDHGRCNMTHGGYRGKTGRNELRRSSRDSVPE